MTPFHHLLANNLVANITNFTVWFALTFWVFLETRSVFATGMIAGIYLVLTAALGIWFGSLVDHHRKKRVMLGSSAASLVLYAPPSPLSVLVPEERFADVGSIALWLFILLVMFGVIAGNVRNIALPTLVTLLVPEDRRDKANGLVGMVDRGRLPDHLGDQRLPRRLGRHGCGAGIRPRFHARSPCCTSRSCSSTSPRPPTRRMRAQARRYRAARCA